MIGWTVDILDGHSRAILRRIAGEPVVLLAQDTTFLSDIRDLQGEGGHAAVDETGGVHSCIRASRQREPSESGVLGHHFWQTPGRAGGRRRAVCPLEEKESDRWLLGYDMACALQTLNRTHRW